MRNARLTRVAWSPIALACAFVVNAATAEDVLTCKGGYSISVGMRAYEVRGRCGDPERRETVRVPIRAKGADGDTYVSGYAQFEYWTYPREPGRPSAVLTFEQAILKKIDLVTRR